MYEPKYEGAAADDQDFCLRALRMPGLPEAEKARYRALLAEIESVLTRQAE